MKIKYQFINESIEIEVSDEWGEILIDLDRQEYNVNHREARRHMSLEWHNHEENEGFDSPYLLDKSADVVAELFRNMNKERVLHAIETLLPQQRELIYKVFYEDRPYSDIAREEGVDRSAVRKRMERILARLKKVL